MTTATPDIESTIRETTSVREAKEADVPVLAASMARGFYDDPVLGWFFPDDGRRLDQLERLFVLMAGDHTSYGRHYSAVYTTDHCVGGALWAPPGAWEFGLLDELKAVVRWAGVAGARGLPRILRGVAVMENNHPHDLHWYLPSVAVDPAWQGRGIGSALMSPVLARCDRERMPAYLEATTPRSRACYERHGFETTAELRLPDGPTMWAMWREPR